MYTHINDASRIREYISSVLTVYHGHSTCFTSLCILPPPASLITRTHTVAAGPDLLRAITPLLVTYRVFHGGRYRKKDKRKEKAIQIDCAAAQWRRDILYVCNWTRVCRRLNVKLPFRVYGWEFAWGSSVRLQEGSMIDVSFREFTLANTFADLHWWTCVIHLKSATD